jgi:hypothetical protein
MIKNIYSPYYFRSQSDFSLDAGRQLEPCEESEQDPREGFKPAVVRDIFLKRKIKAPKSIEKQNSLTDWPLYNASNSRSHVGTLRFTSIIRLAIVSHTHNTHYFKGAAMREITGQRVAIGALLVGLV